jgi:hypothetical protein
MTPCIDVPIFRPHICAGVFWHGANGFTSRARAATGARWGGRQGLRRSSPASSFSTDTTSTPSVALPAPRCAASAVPSTSPLAVHPHIWSILGTSLCIVSMCKRQVAYTPLHWHAWQESSAHPVQLSDLVPSGGYSYIPSLRGSQLNRFAPRLQALQQLQAGRKLLLSTAAALGLALAARLGRGAPTVSFGAVGMLAAAALCVWLSEKFAGWQSKFTFSDYDHTARG